VAIHENGAWQSRMKISSNIEKATDPGRKQLVRYYDEESHPMCDVMYLDGETPLDSGIVRGRNRTWPHRQVSQGQASRGESLLQTAFSGGQRTMDSPSLPAVRERALAQIAALPEEFKRMRNPHIFQSLLSEELGQLKDNMLSNPELA
jgi:nicotinate phosphoribosyltransferase